MGKTGKWKVVPFPPTTFTISIILDPQISFRIENLLKIYVFIVHYPFLPGDHCPQKFHISYGKHSDNHYYDKKSKVSALGPECKQL